MTNLSSILFSTTFEILIQFIANNLPDYTKKIPFNGYLVSSGIKIIYT